MRQLILDHYRRWCWILALCAALEFGLGWFIATGPKIFEFWAFLVAIWSGGTLLSFDMKKGALRPVAILPLTGRQIGRAWWLATVLIPALALTALLFSGAATYYHFHPDSPLAVRPLVMSSLFTLVWLGADFNLAFSATRGFGDSRGEFFRIVLFSWLSMLIFFGSMLLCNGAANSPVKAAFILGGGALLTAVGWLRAEQFAPARAGIYLGRIEVPKLGGARLTPLARQIPPGGDRAPGGYGGIVFLFRTTFLRAFSTLLAMVILMLLLSRWQGQIGTQGMTDLIIRVGSFMSCWFVILYQFGPLQRQLRFLRTLPISTTRLAATMLAIALLPLMAVGALVALIAEWSWGTGAALTALHSYTLILAPTALCLFFVIWRGSGKQGYFLLFLTLFGFLFGGIFLNEISLSPVGLIALATILLSLVLTRHVLSHSSRPYIIQASFSGNLP